MKHAGLILEGGATRGVFTSGVLDYFMEEDFYLPYVAGVSAGACNAVDYVSRQPGRTRDCMIVKEKKHQYMSMKNLVKHRSLFDMEMLFEKYPNEFHPFDYDTYFTSDMVCEMVVTNCLTGKAEYLDDRKNRQRLMDICRASSSMPLVSPMVKIDGTPYLDGGLADSLPLKRAESLGYEKNVVILTRNYGYRKKPSSRADRLYKAAYKKHPQLVKTTCNRPYTYNAALHYIEEQEKAGNIFVIRPTITPVGRTERDVDTLMNFYQHGYDTAKVELTKIKEYLEK